MTDQEIFQRRGEVRQDFSVGTGVEGMWVLKTVVLRACGMRSERCWGGGVWRVIIFSFFYTV